MEIKEDEISPVQQDKSHVDEFLEYCRCADRLGGSDIYLRTLAGYFVQTKSAPWFQGFCKELEILRDMSKIVDAQVKYLKNKHKQ